MAFLASRPGPVPGTRKGVRFAMVIVGWGLSIDFGRSVSALAEQQGVQLAHPIEEAIYADNLELVTQEPRALPWAEKPRIPSVMRWIWSLLLISLGYK